MGSSISKWNLLDNQYNKINKTNSCEKQKVEKKINLKHIFKGVISIMKLDRREI